MSRRYFLGVDVGTYESKGTLIDESGQIVLTAARRHGMEMPQPGWYEHDAETVWWGDFCGLSNELISDSGIDPAEIAGVGASTLGADCVPVDENCRPLRKAILYGIDSRAQEEVDFLNHYYGEEKILSMKGSLMGSEDVMARMLWVKNREPEIYDHAYKLCTGSTYLTAKLTGEYVVDSFLAQTCFFPIYDQDGSIRRDMVEPLLQTDKLARCCPSTAVVGGVTAQAARETGLAEGTPVITGTDDAAAEALSTGVLAPGDMMIMLGSSMYMICVVDQPCQDQRLWHSGYLRPGTSTVQGATNNNGTLTRWMRDNLCRDLMERESATGENAYGLMAQLAQDVPPGSDGLLVLPYFAGERTPINDPNATGAIFGLGLQHTRGHIYRALLEGSAYSIAQHLDILKENHIPLHNVLAVGGGTKNRLWMQIIADITGQTIQTAKVTVGASYGDALLAAVGTGAIDGFDGLAKVFFRAQVYTPNPENHTLYQKYYQIFQQLYPANRELMHSLHSLTMSP